MNREAKDLVILETLSRLASRQRKLRNEYQICSVCGKCKLLTEFYRRMDAKLGRSKICKECIAIQGAKYHVSHKTESAAYNKKYNAEHKEEAAERQAAYNDEHKDEIAEYQKKYRQSELGRLLRRSYRQRRRARKMDAEGDGVTPDEFERIVKNQKYRCNMCGRKFSKSKPATADHIIPLSKGGPHTPENTQALCLSCNCSKKAKIMRRFIVCWDM